MNNLRKFQQLLNEGISQQDLADTLCARLETRYPDIDNKYDYDTVYRAVDDVASFHAGAEELGTSDIGMMLRSVIKRLEEYQGVEEGWKQNLAVAGAIAGTYGGITALHNATPHASVNGVGHYYATFSPPRHAIKTVDDKGNPVYTWKTRTKHGTMNLYRPVDKVGTMQLYRPADKVDQIKEQGVAEGYKEPTDAAGHAKMAAKIKRMLDDTLADRGDRHGNPDPERLTRAYEYHMEKAKEKSQGVAEGTGDQKYMAVYNKHIGHRSYIGKPITSGGEVMHVTASSHDEAKNKFVKIFNRGQVLSSFMGRFDVVPKDESGEQGVAEGPATNIGSTSILQKVVDAAAKYGFKMSNRSKNGQKIILQNNDFHQWMTCRIRNINGKIYIDYDESSNINGLRNEVVTPNEFIQRLKNYYMKGQAWLEKIRKRDAAEKNFVGIRVEQYPYGKPSSGLKAAVKFLNRNGKRGHEYFDFPEYADIPDEISNQLMPEEVDFIQDRWDEVPVGKQGVAEGSVKTPKITFAQKIPGSNSLIDIFVDGRNEFLAAKIGTGIWSVYPIGEGQSSIGAAGSKSELKKKVLDYLSKQGVAEEQLDELKCWDGYKRVPGTKSGAPGSCEKINELSTEKLAQYKKAAGADASKADKEGNFERGNKRFSGIVKATKKQFDNETKPKKESAIMKGIVDETLGTPYPGTYEQENKPFMRKGPKRTMKLTTEGKNHVRR